MARIGLRKGGSALASTAISYACHTNCIGGEEVDRRRKGSRPERFKDGGAQAWYLHRAFSPRFTPSVQPDRKATYNSAVAGTLNRAVKE